MALAPRIRLSIGIALCAIGIALAFRAPPRFYLILTMGSWLVVDAVEDLRYGTSILRSTRTSSGRGSFFALYGLFVILGLIGDGLYGLLITDLWHYPSYGSATDYLLLYLVIYPAGGLFTYGLLRAGLGPNALVAPRERAPLGMAVTAFAVVALAALTLALLQLTIQNNWARLGFSALVFLLSLAALEGMSAARGSAGPTMLLVGRPRLLIGGLALAAFAAFFHELPNVPLHEWEYHNLPIATSIAGVPVVVLLGWTALFVTPWAAANALRSGGQDPFR